MTAKLLVVDDEPRTAELTAEILRRAGYSVDVAGSGTEALERVRLGSPDLMLLDYEMPDMEAPEVLDSLRSGGERIAFPVIILTGARHSPADQVVGIEHGATDYIVKGTDRQVMLARVRGALRERASAAGAVVRGRLHVDAFRGEARLGDRHLKLERRPLLMLQLLANRSGEVVPRSELLGRVWGSSYPSAEAARGGGVRPGVVGVPRCGAAGGAPGGAADRRHWRSRPWIPSHRGGSRGVRLHGQAGRAGGSRGGDQPPNGSRATLESRRLVVDVGESPI